MGFFNCNFEHVGKCLKCLEKLGGGVGKMGLCPRKVRSYLKFRMPKCKFCLWMSEIIWGGCRQVSHKLRFSPVQRFLFE